MSKRRKDQRTLEQLGEELDRDLLTDDTPLTDIEAELVELGADIDAIGARGAQIAQQALERTRLAWIPKAREKLAAARAKLRRALDLSGLSRDQLLARIEAEPIAAAFRGRKPQSATDDELREMVFEIEALKAIAADDKLNGSNDDTDD